MKTLNFCKGKGVEGKKGCWMAALSQWVGQGEWADKLDCVDPIINGLCILINDSCVTDAERNLVVGPRLFDPVGTKGEKIDEARRAIVVRQWAYELWGDYSELARVLKHESVRMLSFIREEIVWGLSGDEKIAASAVKYHYSLQKLADCKSNHYETGGSIAEVAFYGRLLRSRGTWDGRTLKPGELVNQLLVLLDLLIEAGPKAPVEPAITEDELCSVMGCD